MSVMREPLEVKTIGLLNKVGRATTHYDNKSPGFAEYINLMTDKPCDVHIYQADGKTPVWEDSIPAGETNVQMDYAGEIILISTNPDITIEHSGSYH